MVQYFSPGVKVEFVDRGARPIQGASTSVTGAVGVTVRGPTTGKPVLVTSYTEFTRTFGGAVPEPPAALRDVWNDPTNDEGGCWWQFPLAVRGYFENGGKQLYVKRVFAGGRPDPATGQKLGGATGSAATTYRGLVSEVTKGGADATTLTLRHLFGVKPAAGRTVRIINGKTGTAITDGTGGDTFTVTSYDAGARQVTLDKAYKGTVSDARRDYVEVVAAQTAAGSETFVFTATAKGKWGDDLQVRVRPMGLQESTTLTLLASSGLDPTALSTQVTDFKAAAGGVAESITVADKGLKAGDTVLIAGAKYTLKDLAAGADPVKFEFTPAKPAGAGQDWKADKPIVRKVRRANPKPVTFGMAAFTAQAGPTPESITVDRAGLAAGNDVVINGKPYKLKDLTAGADPVKFELTTAVPGAENWAANKPAVRLVQAGDKKVLANGAGRSVYRDALVELDNGTATEVLSVAVVDGNEVTFATAPALEYFEGHVMRIIETEVTVRYVRTVDGAEQVEAEEAFSHLRLADPADPLHLVNVITRRSALVAVTAKAGVPTSLADLPRAKTVPWQPFTGGDDALADLRIEDFVGEDLGSDNRTGLVALEDVTDVSLVLTPGMWSQSVRNAAVTQCENLKYRFLITDPPPKKPGTTNPIEDIRKFRAPIDTTYAALYFPWLVVRDPLTSKNVACPPSGHMAGLYARVDGERGVQKAPANEIVRGVLAFEQDVTEREQDLLNPVGINALRFFPGRGLRCWGARTLSTSDANFRYVNVRRIFNFVGKSIDDGTQFTVFEPNDELLWSRVRQTVGNFLDTQWRTGVLEGKTADDAFFVNCDRGLTMTQTDIENGYLICEVGISPVYPAEFVVFRIQKYVSASKQSA